MIDPSWEVDVPSVLAMDSVRIIDIRTDDEVDVLLWRVLMSIFPWIAYSMSPRRSGLVRLLFWFVRLVSGPAWQPNGFGSRAWIRSLFLGGQPVWNQSYS